MNLLFVHDHVFFRENESFYSDKLPYPVWSRYLSHFSSLTIFSRYTDDCNIDPHIPLSSGEHVSFVTAENISNLRSFFGPRQKEFHKLEAMIGVSDAVVARLPSQFGIAAVYLAKKLNKPVLVEVVSCAWDSLWNYGGVKAKMFAPFLYLKMRQAISLSDSALYVSSSFLQKRYPCSGSVIGVSDVEIPYPDRHVILNRIMNISTKKGKYKIGLVGSLKTRYKGVDIAIKAMANLINSGFDVSLHVLGGGNSLPYKELARRLGVEEFIFFEGVLTPGDPVLRWLDAKDIYIQPSLVEGMPRAVLEAMSRGLPTVASRVGGIPEVLSSDMLVKPGDDKGLSDKISRIISDADLQKAQAMLNFEVARRFSKDDLDQKRDLFFHEFAQKVGAAN
jgi:glycosyltransferase involved in cell wall biosynthesis